MSKYLSGWNINVTLTNEIGYDDDTHGDGVDSDGIGASSDGGVPETWWPAGLDINVRYPGYLAVKHHARNIGLFSEISRITLVLVFLVWSPQLHQHYQFYLLAVAAWAGWVVGGTQVGKTISDRVLHWGSQGSATSVKYYTETLYIDNDHNISTLMLICSYDFHLKC